jgi:hypothetical protein
LEGNESLPGSFTLGEQKEQNAMKLRALTIAALLALAAGMGTAAQAVEFNVGPGGVYVNPDNHRHYYRDRDYGQNCRTIITHHTNRYGEDVTDRRRVCD